MSVRRIVSQHAIRDLIDPVVFQPRTGLSDVPSTTRYRIPEHQRFPSWPLNKKQRLVESVLNNWPIHSLLLTKHIEVIHNPDSGEQEFADFYNIADGQTRLTSLQEFYLDKFATCDNILYSELTPDQQYNFVTYQVTTEVFITDRLSPTAAREMMANIFERVNSGKALGDNDKYYARRETPVVKTAIGLSESEAFRTQFSKFVGVIGGGKTRKLLGDMVGAILSLTARSERHLNTSYERNFSYILNAPTAIEIEDINAFFQAYFDMLNSTIGEITVRPGKIYGKLSGILGLAVCSWINTGHIADAIAWYATVRYYNSKYEPPTFADLTTGDRRNCQGAAIRNRLEKIIQQYQDPTNVPINNNDGRNISSDEEAYDEDTD